MVQRNTSDFNRVDKLTQQPTVLVLFQVFEVKVLMAPSPTGSAKGLLLDPSEWLFVPILFNQIE